MSILLSLIAMWSLDHKFYLTRSDLFCPYSIQKNNRGSNGTRFERSNGNKLMLENRGGVKDTRLEAKAKDTKKIRGQGQPFRGQNLSRPRTGMLEAKAKDQGHRRKRSPKKRSSKFFFSIDLQFIGVPRIFDCERPKPQIT